MAFDRLHQGMLNRLMVTRSMARQFASHPKIMELGIVMADSDVRFWGISGGAILGGSFAALSPEVKRAALRFRHELGLRPMAVTPIHTTL